MEILEIWKTLEFLIFLFLMILASKTFSDFFFANFCLTCSAQVISEARSCALLITLKSSDWLFTLFHWVSWISIISIIPPLKSCIASDAIPPLRDSYDPWNLAYAFSNKHDQNSDLSCDCMKSNWPRELHGSRSSITISTQRPKVQNLKIFTILVLVF